VTGSPAEDGLHCADCGARVVGEFCSACGQRRGVPKLSFGALTADLVETTLDTDARLWRTLRTLLREPGALTLAWAAGQRTRYLSPFRLYLVLNVVAFLVMSLGDDPGPDGSVIESRREARAAAELSAEDESGLRSWLVSLGYAPSQVETTLERILADPADFGRSIFERTPTMLVLLLPILATLLRACYARRPVPWVVHLVGLAHLHACFFLTWLLVDGADGIALVVGALGAPRLGIWLDDLGALLGTLFFAVYLVRWVQRLYGHPLGSAVAMSGLIAALHIAGVGAGLFALFLGSLWLAFSFGA
jgi:hypothetical protein